MIPLLLLLQDEAIDARIGEIPSQILPSASWTVHCSPSFDRAVVSYLRDGREGFVLENGFEEPRPRKWLGWHEGASVLLGEGQRLLIGGVEKRSDVWDAALFGDTLALVISTPEGRTLRLGDRSIGPFDSIDFLGAPEPVYSLRKGERTELCYRGRVYAALGKPIQTFLCGDRIAWLEKLDENRRQVVVDGERLAVASTFRGGVRFTPDGRHYTFVTRDGDRFRAYLDGREIPSEHSIVEALAFEDGRCVAVEVEGGRGRLVVNGIRQERVLPRPIFTLERDGSRIVGVSRDEKKSVIAWVGDSVEYEEIEGRIERFLPANRRRAFLVRTETGLFVQVDAERTGPWENAELFHLKIEDRFGYVAQQRERVLFFLGRTSRSLALSEFVSPVRISKTEMTAAVVGVVHQARKREIWVRAVPIE